VNDLFQAYEDNAKPVFREVEENPNTNPFL
jgi:hypothetical protein